MRYLDPKNDLTFKKIFGQNPDLLMSLLNALMPLAPDQEIVSVEYLPAELVPEIPELKNSIVDVRCVDNHKRQFIVEMQMLWTPSFKYRMLFNASKAYVQQLGVGKKYESLQPVYALSLINDIFLDNDLDFYHHYSIVNVEKPALRLEGLEFVFVELPKFKPQTVVEKKMAALWLRFLTEIEDGNETIAPDLFANEMTHKALDILQVSAFTKEELEAYDRCWDAIRKEMTYASEKAHIAEVKGRNEGKIEGQIEVTERMIVKSHKKGMTVAEIAEFTDTTDNVVKSVLLKNGLI